MSKKLKQIALSKANNPGYLERLEVEFSEIEKGGMWDYFENIDHVIPDS